MVVTSKYINKNKLRTYLDVILEQLAIFVDYNLRISRPISNVKLEDKEE